MVKCSSPDIDALSLLKDYEQWEADIILENKCWTGQNIQLTDELYERMIGLQTKRNQVIAALTSGAAAPSKEAMMAAVELEILSSLGRVHTVKIGDLIQKIIDARTPTAAQPSLGHSALIPTPEQIEPILDDYLGVDCPHYEEMRRRCAQRIFDLCAVMSGIPITPSDNRVSPISSTDQAGGK